MNKNIIITEENFDQKVPIDMFPTRLDSAINIYTSISGKYNGIVLYNIRPEWNTLTSFYALNHKFTVDEYFINNKDITFKDLIEIYNNEFNKTHVINNSYNLEKRKQTAMQEFCDLFDVDNVKLGEELNIQYELKYSKRMNVWTLYRLESFVLKVVNSIEKLLNQKTYKQEIVSYNTEIIVNGVEILGNVYETIKDKNNIEILKNSAIKLD